jgi:hypothetical protein
VEVSVGLPDFPHDTASTSVPAPSNSADRRTTPCLVI